MEYERIEKFERVRGIRREGEKDGGRMIGSVVELRRASVK